MEDISRQFKLANLVISLTNKADTFIIGRLVNL